MEFDQALARLTGAGEKSGGIGTLGEKTLHATLKLWLDSDTAHHEIPLAEGCVADIFDGERVTEIQTAGFSGFRPKLARLLEHYPVTVVHPVVRRKSLVWIDPATGETTPPHRSPRVGTFADAGEQLIYILPLIGHPHLTVRLVLVDVEEHRLADGRRSRDGKRGSHRVERYPLALGDSCTLQAPADYAALLPPELGETFTSKEFGKAARLQGRKLQGTLKVLLTCGVVTRERNGRAYRYTVIHEV